jgi:hypothetical protein
LDFGVFSFEDFLPELAFCVILINDVLSKGNTQSAWLISLLREKAQL